MFARRLPQDSNLEELHSSLKAYTQTNKQNNLLKNLPLHDPHDSLAAKFPFDVTNSIQVSYLQLYEFL